MSEVHSFLQWFKQYFQSSTSSTLVFWYVLVISCWTVLGSGLYVYPNSVWWSYCSLQNLKSHASSMFIYSLALCSYDSLIVYPAYVAVPSQMLSAVFSSSYVLLPLLSLSYIPNPWLHPLATVTGPCCSELRVLLFCLLLDQSPITLWLSQSLFLIHEYEVTHVKCIRRVLPSSDELYILCSCMSPWCVTNTNHEHSSRDRRNCCLISSFLFSACSLIMS